MRYHEQMDRFGNVSPDLSKHVAGSSHVGAHLAPNTESRKVRGADDFEVTENAKESFEAGSTRSDVVSRLARTATSGPKDPRAPGHAETPDTAAPPAEEPPKPQEELGPPAAPRDPLNAVASRNLLNMLRGMADEAELRSFSPLEDGVAVTMMETFINKVHRDDERRKKDAARLVLLIMKAHGAYVYEHCTRLVDLALELSNELGLADEKTQLQVQQGVIYRDLGEVAFFLTKSSPRQRYALQAFLDGIDMAQESLLHDIGKIEVPAEILYKPGPLNEAELEIMRQHPVWGAELLSRIPELSHAIPVTLHHHERWDGDGYPHRLRGEKIPIAARIVCVVDAWDALVSDRPYRKAFAPQEACERIAEGAGTHFDPQVARKFLSMVHRVWSPDRQY